MLKRYTNKLQCVDLIQIKQKSMTFMRQLEIWAPTGYFRIQKNWFFKMCDHNYWESLSFRDTNEDIY